MNSEEILWFKRGNDYEIFPRYIKRVIRSVNCAYIVKDELGLIDYINYNRGYDIYVSVYSIWQLDNEMYDTVIFDIDVHDDALSSIEMLSRAYDRLKVVRGILNNLGVDFSRVYVTGRGFHAFVDFDLTNIVDFSKKYLDFVVKNGLKPYIDMHMIDIGFFSRYLGTRNSKINSGIIVKRIDFTKDTFKEAFVGVAPWNKYNNMVSLLEG